MTRSFAASLIAVSGAIACSSGSSGSPRDGGAQDTGRDAATPPVDAGHEAGGGKDGGTDSGGPTTTIAKARVANTSGAFTVDAVVTALAGVPKDYPGWYIEDPAGGPNSGVAIYCDPKATTPCTIAEPALHDLIELTGSFSPYNGQQQIIPTAMKVLAHDAKLPPVATLAAKDVAPGATSPYRGVFVKLAIASKLVVDDVTPAALADTACGAVIPTDGGVEGGAKDGGASDAGPPHCTNPCLPPLYSGFRANDGAGNEVYIEAPFFHTDPLQSSPECLTQAGVVPVTVGTTFSEMSGILDVDPYGKVQNLAPVQPTDYATP